MTDAARALAAEALRKARGKLAAFFPSQSETLHEIDQSLAALSAEPPVSEAAQPDGMYHPELMPEMQPVVDWAVSRWMAEVKNRPLRNVHRRSLDDAWRQVIRYFGRDDRALCGPAHDELIDTSPPVSDAARALAAEAREALKARFRSIAGPDVIMPLDEVWDGYVRAVFSVLPVLSAEALKPFDEFNKELAKEFPGAAEDGVVGSVGGSQITIGHIRAAARALAALSADLPVTSEWLRIKDPLLPHADPDLDVRVVSADPPVDWNRTQRPGGTWAADDPPVSTDREARAGSLEMYADGVSKLADTSKTDDGWLRALAIALREAAAFIRQPVAAECEEAISELSFVRGQLLEGANVTQMERVDSAIALFRRLVPAGDGKPIHIMIGPPPHRMVAAFDDKGEQVPEWQGPLADVLHRVAPSIFHVEIVGEQTYTPSPPMEDKS